MSNEVFVTVRINDKCKPLDRGEFYEDPLQEALDEKKLGEIVGGGSRLNKQNLIEYCEIEVLVTGDLEETTKVITETLEDQGLPKGSKIILDDKEVLIGNHDVLALHFNNKDLADSVYEDNDINEVLSKVEELLGETGQRNSYTNSNEESIIYYGGASFDVMKQKIGEFVASHPLCDKGKITQAA